jgi:tetratricopeptide (TPR) repeat protein
VSEELEDLPDEETPVPAAPAAPAAASRRPVIKKRRKRKERQEELEQPDEFVEVGGTIVDWVIEHGKPIGIGLGAVLGILLIWGIVEKVDSGNRLDAAEALYLAAKDLPGAAGPVAPGAAVPEGSGDRLQKLDGAVVALDAVAKDHAGTPQAALASLEAGSALFREGRYEDALTRFDAAVAGKGPAAEYARNSRAYALESLGRVDEAATAFDAVRKTSKGGAREQATLDLARVYEASGKTDQARSLYEEFEAEFPESALLADAQARAAAIAAK